MPRYYFHLVDGEFLSDDLGLECQTGEEVKQRAVEIAGEMLRDQGLKLWRTGRADMFVVDENNKTQLTLSIEAEDLTGQLNGEADTAIKGTG